MILKNQQDILYTWTKTIYMIMLCQNLLENSTKFNIDQMAMPI